MVWLLSCSYPRSPERVEHLLVQERSAPVFMKAKTLINIDLTMARQIEVVFMNLSLSKMSRVKMTLMIATRGL